MNSNNNALFTLMVPSPLPAVHLEPLFGAWKSNLPYEDRPGSGLE
jgi:hypothetical protein